MKKKCMILCLAICCIAVNAYADENAAPQKAIQKVREAAAFITSAGEEGLREFMDKNGRWVWKGSYVFVLYCEKGTVAAHSMKPKLVGKNLMGLKDTNGKLFFAEFCNAAKKPKGDWVEYTWPKIGEKTPSRKMAYVGQVPGTPYQVIAGLYDENASVEEWEKMIQ